MCKFGGCVTKMKEEREDKNIDVENFHFFTIFCLGVWMTLKHRESMQVR